MYSSSDFEKFWFLYKTEGEPNGISINAFCVSNGIPYTQFYKWFRNTRQPIVPVEVVGAPVATDTEKEMPTASAEKEPIRKYDSNSGIRVIIQSRSGLQIKKSNLSYQELKNLVEKLEGLC